MYIMFINKIRPLHFIFYFAVVYLTFTLMYGGIITRSFITCKLHLKQSSKVPQPVLQIIPEKPLHLPFTKSVLSIFNVKFRLSLLMTISFYP